MVRKLVCLKMQRVKQLLSLSLFMMACATVILFIAPYTYGLNNPDFLTECQIVIDAQQAVAAADPLKERTFSCGCRSSRMK